jgi:predicted dehydrogenase
LIPLFKLHPLVDKVALCDLNAQKLQAAAREFDIPHTFPSLDAVCQDDRIDAVALVTQHWLHAPQAIQALRAGKHVYSSVPAGLTVDEVAALVQAVDETRKTYVMGETSYYYSWVYYCKQRFQANEFGRIIHSTSDYFHDLEHGLRKVFKERGGERWREEAVIPPMFYITHCTSQIIAVTGAHMTHVSCHGFVDDDEDQVFQPERNVWGNAFSNQTALFRMSDGSSCSANVWWRVGHPTMVQMAMFGTQASFQFTHSGMEWIDRSGGVSVENQVMPRILKPRWAGPRLALAARRLQWRGIIPSSWFRPTYGVRTPNGAIHDVAPLQPVDTLPKEYVGLYDMGGEEGTNYFMVNEFVRAAALGETPPNDVRMAARYTLPGIIAYESAVKGGELLTIPDFGVSPRSSSSTLSAAGQAEPHI